MIFATTGTSHFVPANNLSTACKHYTAYVNLRSTIKDTLETCRNR